MLIIDWKIRVLILIDHQILSNIQNKYVINAPFTFQFEANQFQILVFVSIFTHKKINLKIELATEHI